MATKNDRKDTRAWKKIRIRKRLSGTPERPRVCLFKSLKYVYAQAVDDLAGATIAAASSQEASMRGALKTSGKHVKVAEEVGKALGERLKAKGVETVVFDRSGYLYHGRVKALAEGVRKVGLKF